MSQSFGLSLRKSTQQETNCETPSVSFVPNEKRVDITFIFDTTGSMDGKIQALIKTSQNFVMQCRQKELDAVFNLISFGDLAYPGSTDTIFVETTNEKNVEDIQKALSHMKHNSGYANNGESSMQAMSKALTLSFRLNTVKMFVLITDEPAIEGRNIVLFMQEQVKERGIMVFTVAPNIDYFKTLAQTSGGFWSDIDTCRDFEAMLSVFQKIAQKIATTADNVHMLAAGDVKRYLALPSGKK